MQIIARTHLITSLFSLVSLSSSLLQCSTASDREQAVHGMLFGGVTASRSLLSIRYQRCTDPLFIPILEFGCLLIQRLIPELLSLEY